MSALKVITHKAAKELGLKHYFTGKPCRRGHVSRRKISSRNCCDCDLEHSRGNPKKLAYMAKYSAENREKENARARQWYAENKKRHQAGCKAYYEENKDSVSAMNESWRKSNKEKVRAYSRARKARVRAAEGTWTAPDIERLMIEQRGACVYCMVALDASYHVDHIMPLYLGGSNWPENLQLLCKTCNLSKGKKHPDDFIPNHPPLLT